MITADYILITVIAILIIAALFSIHRQKKNGGSCCSGCSGCCAECQMNCSKSDK